MDANYRTIPSAASRGIAGHSMGGNGAIMLAMKHPGVLGAVYAMSPCCVTFEADHMNKVHERIETCVVRFFSDVLKAQ